MRAWIVLATASASVAIVAACASSEDEVAPPPETPPATVPDADAPDADVPDVDVPDTRLPDCSTAGWCITAFPDENLVFRDIWPLEDVAFAIAESQTEGVKFLEWRKSTNTWEYIDDLSQNGAGSGSFAGGVYAPSADEVYFAVGGSFVYHGKRNSLLPDTQWTWTRTKLPDSIVDHPKAHEHGKPYSAVAQESVAAFGVVGFGVDEVYAHYSNTIFKRDASGGTWTAVYTVDDLESEEEHAFFVAATGTGPDDIWFVGARDRRYYNCPLVVRKTTDGWKRVIDGVVQDDIFAPCSERAGTLHVGGTSGGWITDIRSVSATEYVALHDEMEWGFFKQVNLTRIRVADGDHSFEQSTVPVKIAQAGPPATLSSLWRGNGETWFTSFGLVLRGTDDGTFAPSTLSRDGAPVGAPLYKIRGTSNQNLWAIGAHHAYHKTTP